MIKARTIAVRALCLVYLVIAIDDKMCYDIETVIICERHR